MPEAEWPKSVRPHCDEKLYRLWPLMSGPDLIHRTYDAEDSFLEIVDYIDGPRPNSNIPVGKIPLKAVQKDPFGLDSFFVLYSLNKKKRWEIPRRLDDIEDFQNPSESLRVTCFERALDPIFDNVVAFMQHDAWFATVVHPKLRAIKMNTVYPDGEVVHREANFGALGRDLYMRPNPPRRRRGRRIKNPEEPIDVSNSPSEEGLQPWKRNVHSLYIITRYWNSKSMINKSVRKYVEPNIVCILRARLEWELREEYDHNEVPASYCGCWKCMEYSDVDYDPDQGFVPESKAPERVTLDEYFVQKTKKMKTRKRKFQKKEETVCERYENEDFEIVPSEDTEPEEPKEIAPIEVPVLPKFNPAQIPSGCIKKVVPAVFLPPAIVYQLPNALIFHQDEICWINELQDAIGPSRYPVPRTTVLERILNHDLVGDVELYGMETSLPKDLVPPSFAYCSVCFCLDVSGFSLPCGHFFCFDCWRSRFAIGISRNLVPISCMEPECKEQLSTEAALCFIPDQLVRRYRDLLAKAIVLQPGYLNCWKCSRIVHVVNEDNHIAVKCFCGALSCGECKQKVHLPASCKEFEMYSDLLRRNGQSISVISSIHNTVGMQCPKCRQLVFRTFGCASMRCICGTSFCYSCGRRYGAINHSLCGQRAESTWTLIDVDVRHMGNVPRTVFEKLVEIRSLKSYEALKAPKRNCSYEAVRAYVDIVDFLELATIALFYRTQRRYPKKDDFRHIAARKVIERLGYVLKRQRFDRRTMDVSLKICAELSCLLQ
ncbi:hypothetical protein QR680_013968 [Steinernema hermaphroditum]|uniref:RBR-type E3 ubiquitin transferase n=1 Tax=Steinernema hermaphroditum TaxID=289476 RepID=A0AA39I9W0_9BILA|nr:hypothetical protein QR680_013968 [Steinernema hermaphroditum]